MLSPSNVFFSKVSGTQSDATYNHPEQDIIETRHHYSPAIHASGARVALGFAADRHAIIAYKVLLHPYCGLGTVHIAYGGSLERVGQYQLKSSSTGRWGERLFWLWLSFASR
jgi:hypothetical protein